MMIGTMEAARSRRQMAEAVFARQHDVEHDERDSLARQYQVHLPSRSRDKDQESTLGENLRQNPRNRRVVFDQQYLRVRFCLGWRHGWRWRVKHGSFLSR